MNKPLCKVNRRYRRAVARVNLLERNFYSRPAEPHNLPEWQARKLAFLDLCAAKGYAHRIHTSHFGRLAMRYGWDMIPPFTPSF